MAVCSAAYKFLLIDIGDTGRLSDESVYFNSNLGLAIEKNYLNLPVESILPSSKRLLPYVFIGDDAFGLKPNMMKPYPPTHSKDYLWTKELLTIDYRGLEGLSKMRFGIAASRFRVFGRPIIAKVEKVVAITKAVAALHNF